MNNTYDVIILGEKSNSLHSEVSETEALRLGRLGGETPGELARQLGLAGVIGIAIVPHGSLPVEDPKVGELEARVVELEAELEGLREERERAQRVLRGLLD